MTWPDEAVADGSATTPGHPSRSALFTAVRADPAGPEATRLLQLAHADAPHVRRAALDLLHGLAGTRAVDAALTRLDDPDAGVRHRAARLVGQYGPPERVRAALAAVPDPVVRTLLAASLGPAVARLGDDRLASVRFLARLHLLRTAPPARWRALDAALMTDAEEAALHLEGAGRLWGRALHQLAREQHAYDIAARLLADPGTRGVGAELAREACHIWRAAPVALLPLIVRHQSQETEITPGLDKAVATALLSGAARRTHRSLLTEVPSVPPPAAVTAPAPLTAASAALLLSARPVGIVRLRRAGEIFGALLDSGPLSFRQAAQLYNLTFHRPGRAQAECAPLWLRHAGPAALPRLLALMTPHLADYAIGTYYLAGLARMGRAARPALPAVTALIDRRTRIPVNDSTRDGETRLDERLLAAALATRRALLADTD
ncbi:HEAT repeat domain-containing protein [Streptomyces antibioticus]|uniref:HEAT repeat domain-containing protein n=1 Tax=Streptomyces antibioticus TaxID=1890 RepID=UPI00371AC90B